MEEIITLYLSINLHSLYLGALSIFFLLYVHTLHVNFCFHSFKIARVFCGVWRFYFWIDCGVFLAHNSPVSYNDS